MTTKISDEPMVLYFAYGSNMHQERLEARVGDVANMNRAILRTWQFSYSAGNMGYSFKHQRARFYANIHQSESGVMRSKARVWGVLFALRQSQLEKLDHYEGTQRPGDLGYYRKEFYVHVPLRHNHNTPFAGDMVKAWVYIAKPEYTWRIKNHYPNHEYMYHVLRGAFINQLDRRYIEQYLVGGSSTQPFAYNP